MLGTTPVGRRLLVPSALAVAVAIWLLGSIHFQDQIPIVKRAATLSPSKLEASAEDRYRLNERANVLAEIRAHPITGLGVTIPWEATAQTLSLEVRQEGRQYVHFAALWFWLKLGILGLFAYSGMMIASMWLAWQAWRASDEPLLRAFALASLCGDGRSGGDRHDGQLHRRRSAASRSLFAAPGRAARRSCCSPVTRAIRGGPCAARARPVRCITYGASSALSASIE